MTTRADSVTCPHACYRLYCMQSFLEKALGFFLKVHTSSRGRQKDLETMRRLDLAVVSLAYLGRTVNAAFGLTSKSNSWSVDTNGGLVFEVSK